MAKDERGATSLVWEQSADVALRHDVPGDKIVLSQQILEDLLNANARTTTIQAESENPGFSLWNSYDNFTHPHSRIPLYDRNAPLPSPLTFRVECLDTQRVAYAGVRDFSSETVIGIGDFLWETLKLEYVEETRRNVKVSYHELPKGTYVRLRPLEAGYDPEDWKALLERQLRSSFTTLTVGSTLRIPHGKEIYEFLVDKVSPEREAICIIDTDIEVDIEPLNEEQARETLKRITERRGRTSETSGGGEIKLDQELSGQVQAGNYVDYTIRQWDRSRGLSIELDVADGNALDLFISPFSSRQRDKPREDNHIFENVSDQSTKVITIQPTNIEIVEAESILISVRGYVTDAGKTQSPRSFIIRALSPSKSSQDHIIKDESQASRNPDDAQCKNCLQWVPRRTMMLHENFCYRNNVLCPQCQHVFQKNSTEWKDHWHCPHDSTYGNNLESKTKHDSFMHTPQACTCGYQTKNMAELARHRTSTCPEKIILCQFCHLLVPQKGPEDLDSNEPEVILSGLTPHELTDGGRTTECHMCGKIIRMRDMTTHAKHHNLERLTRTAPRMCHNNNCAHTLDGVGPRGQINRPQPSRNDIGLCDTCFGPLYVSSFDPDGKQLRKRIERRYLTQLITGCGKDHCRNQYCKTARQYSGEEDPEKPFTSKQAMQLVSTLTEVFNESRQLYFCTDESNQRRRLVADLIAAEGDDQNSKVPGYSLKWCIAALEAEGGDLDKARQWLHNWAPTKHEEQGDTASS